LPLIPPSLEFACGKITKFHMLSGVLWIQETVQQAQSWAGGRAEPWVETAKGVEEKGCVDVEQGGGDPVLCLTQYLII
jgi:hypothetical protein